MKKKKYNPLKVAQGSRRKAHFESGATPAMWRGRATRFRDQKKEASRKACRKKIF